MASTILSMYPKFSPAVCNPHPTTKPCAIWCLQSCLIIQATVDSKVWIYVSYLTSSTRLFISLTSLWFSCSNWTQIHTMNMPAVCEYVCMCTHTRAFIPSEFPQVRARLPLCYPPTGQHHYHMLASLQNIKYAKINMSALFWLVRRYLSSTTAEMDIN